MAAIEAFWSDKLTARAWRRILFVLFCAAPLLSGVIGHLVRPSHWFRDYEAMACAGQRLDQGPGIYDAQAACDGMEATPYIYLPFVAKSFAAAQEAVGPTIEKVAYAGLFIASIGFLIWCLILRPDAPGRLWDRMAVMGLLTGNTVYWGNISIMLHAIVCALALIAPRRPLLMALGVAACIAVKPVFLTYCAVFLLMDLPIWKRIGLAATAAGLGLAPTAGFYLAGGEMFSAWIGGVQSMALNRVPGDGFYAWLSWLGVGANGVAATATYVVFALAITICALLIAERAGLSAQNRVWLGVGLAGIANPRILPYDIILLAPLIGVLVVTARTCVSDSRQRRAIVALSAGMCAVAMLGNSLDVGLYTMKACTLGVAIAMIVLTLALQRPSFVRQAA